MERIQYRGNPATDVEETELLESIWIEKGILYNPQGLLLRIVDMGGRVAFYGTSDVVSLPSGVYVLHCEDAVTKLLF